MTNNNSRSPIPPHSSSSHHHGSSSRWQLKKMFQRTASVGADIISTHIDDRQGDTEFFASLEETDHNLACLKRSEVEVGLLLGKGTFTEVHAITGIVLDQSALVGSNNKHQKKKREELRSTVNNNKKRQQQEYALKHLSRETLQATCPKTLARAARELVNDAKYLSRLSQHSNIATLRGITLDAFGHNYLAHQFDDFFLILDRLSPVTLADRIYREWRVAPNRGTEPDEDLIPMKANYAFQIAKALRYCHENGVLYRDLKPANCAFALHDPHCIQLYDFGLARDFVAQQSYRLTLAGTRRYLAGEVLTTGAYTWKSDTYSWAMTYYEMCTERKPYHGVTAAEHQLYVCEQGERPTVDDYYFPEALDDILANSWHPNVHQRWSMDQVCRQMQTFLMQLDVSYYEQKEGDFLFDLELPAQQYIEPLALEEGLLVSSSFHEQQNHNSTSSMDLDVDGWMVKAELVGDTEMKTSFKSVGSNDERASSDTPPVEQARRQSLSSTGQPRKIISEAA
ncbi:activated protein kinase kinase kinase 7 [Seminavis robusta]|uniref:Activated protein kinase kinase kinase 7 n=1 Tax=Seminavis robusta TaxID=568900 RepID=A0A9N8F147_9STRA|nr:activated protein kinase kinase kinase 7 [Seminavis robusta]|eukprot:Sro3018_g342160.1 activated protein kinase kinase kinase 7 (510) ;mRNA; f:3940-5469